MPLLHDITYGANVIERALGFVRALAAANWKRARRRGVPGVAGEVVRTVAGSNAWNFIVPVGQGWAGSQIVEYLAHYGIKRTWNHGVTSKFIHFTVERRQANWAEYLMLRRGIPVAGKLFNPAHEAITRQRAPSSPPAWADRKRR